MRKADWTPTTKQLANPKNAIRNLNQSKHRLKQDKKELREQLNRALVTIERLRGEEVTPELINESDRFTTREQMERFLGNARIMNEMRELINPTDNFTCCKAQSEPSKPKSFIERLASWLK